MNSTHPEERFEDFSNEKHTYIFFPDMEQKNSGSLSKTYRQNSQNGIHVSIGTFCAKEC